MPNPIFLQVRSNRRITLPEEEFKEGDLAMITKITKAEMDKFLLDLRKKEDQKIINSFETELGET